MRLQVLDKGGRPLDAHLDLEDGDIVYHSRSGTRGTPSARNLDYGPALRILLDRVRASGHRLRGVWLDSEETLHLPAADRSILGGADLAASPDEQFRILSRAMQVFGRAAGAAYGGSRVKRIRLAGDWPRGERAIREIFGLVGRPGPVLGDLDERAPDDLLPSTAGNAPDDDQPFDPSSIEDGRRLIATMVRRRQGQASFRRKLLEAYGGRCAITACALTPLLEAAHIHPYRGPETNAVQNGLLLRADIHTLFDLGLITISPMREVQLSAALMNSEYRELCGRPIALPSAVEERPSELALTWHRNAHFGADNVATETR